MRHVTDGELHAFLDGGLDLLPDGRGEEVREHLSTCAACRERLQDEEQIHSRASDLLSGPSLEGMALPSFEELRERAEASAPSREVRGGPGMGENRHRGPLTGLPMAWAATIILAVGVGWMGGQVWRGLPGDRTPAGTIPIVEDTPSPSLYRADLESGMEESNPDQPQGNVVRAAPDSRTDAEGQAPGTGPENLEARALAADAPRKEGAPPAPELGRQAEERDSRQEEAPVEQAPLALDALRLQGETESALGFREKVVGRPELVTDSVENSLAVPGLRVVSIGWEERVRGEKALLIRQVLSPGDTLELRYLGMLLGTEPEPTGGRAALTPMEDAIGERAYANILEASLPPGWTQVVMERGRGLLVARAPISEENLKALLKSLR